MTSIFICVDVDDKLPCQTSSSFSSNQLFVRSFVHSFAKYVFISCTHTLTPCDVMWCRCDECGGVQQWMAATGDVGAATTAAATTVVVFYALERILLYFTQVCVCVCVWRSICCRAARCFFCSTKNRQRNSQCALAWCFSYLTYLPYYILTHTLYNNNEHFPFCHFKFHISSSSSSSLFLYEIFLVFFFCCFRHHHREEAEHEYVFVCIENALLSH